MLLLGDGYKRPKGSKLHLAVDTLGHLLAARVTPANEQEPDLGQRGGRGGSVVIWYVDQGYTGDQTKHYSAHHGIELCVVKLPQAKRGFVLLPKRWVLERSFAWGSRLRRLARDFERLSETLVGLRFLAFISRLLAKLPDALRGFGTKCMEGSRDF